VATTEAGAAAPPTPGGAGIATGGVPLQVVVSSSTSITADKRTNQIIVITNPGNLVFFDNLIAKLDVSAEAQTAIEVFQMKHADAVEMGSLLSQFVSGRSGSSSTSDRQPRSSRTTPFPNLNAEIQNLSTPATQRAQAVQDAVSDVIEGQGSQFSDVMTIVPDERTNSLVVSGTNDDLRLIGSVIEKLDIILAQVHIDAVIAEVTLGDDLVRGLDAFDLVYDANSNDFSFQNRVDNDGNILPAISGVLGGIGLAYNATDELVNIVYNASNGDSRDRINILANPSVATTHNREASIIVATALPIVTGTQRADFTGGGQFTTTQYQDIGIELTVKPIIGPNDVIQLEVSQKADDVTGSVDVGNGVTQPEISRREANSFLILKDGQVAVLGGLQRENDQKTVQKVFLLGDIPVVGELFRKTTTKVRKQDLLIFLRPTIIHNTDEADVATRERIRGLRVNEDGSRKLEEMTGEQVEPHREDVIQRTIDTVRPSP
jgi:general secretion pathway protein D